ncbi:unnamed protein product [Calypogeia fissa]
MAAAYLSSSPSDIYPTASASLLRARSATTTTTSHSPFLLASATNLVARRKRSFGISFICATALSHRLRIQHHQLYSSGRGGEGGPVSVRAARMESNEVPLAFGAPAFELPEPLTGKTWKLDDFEDQQGLLVMFICNHCPFVVHLKESLSNFAREYQQKGLGVVAISSNSVETHPQDGPTYMGEDANKYGYSFPYLYDETQEVAKAYGAVCTPDFFLFKKEGRKPFELAYHGRYDETRPRTNATPTGRELKAAADALLSGQSIPGNQKPSIGCSIKWHPGK